MPRKGTRQARRARLPPDPVSDAFNERLTRYTQKNGPLGKNQGIVERWEDYIELGYNPMDAEWCFLWMDRQGVPFDLDEDGQFWYSQDRLSISAGMRCSIEYRREELGRLLREGLST